MFVYGRPSPVQAEILGGCWGGTTFPRRRAPRDAGSIREQHPPEPEHGGHRAEPEQEHPLDELGRVLPQASAARRQRDD